jgi:glucose/arabinose dehydrogenase
VVTTVLSGTLAGCAFGPPSDGAAGETPNLPAPSATQDPSRVPLSVVASVLATGLDVPWDIAFLPDGTALVTERDTRRILAVGPDTDADGLVVRPTQTIEEANSRGEGGLLGIAVSPDYATDKSVFIYYTAANDNRIAELKLGERPKPIVTGIPVSGIHNGGRLRFGPDGFLYASTGDASRGGLAQSRASLGGKILRMTTAGKPAPGNPDPDSLVWSYGHRDVQGLAWDTHGHLFATEFGQSTWDEINFIEPGNNYGWPTVEGIADEDGFTDPIQQWAPRDASCSGVAITGSVLVAACLRGERLWLLRLTEVGEVLGPPTAALVNTYGRMRAAELAPDGSIWVSTTNQDNNGTPTPDGDKILRIVATGGGGASTL